MQKTKKQTLGGENWCLLKIFEDVLGVWPTKITLDTLLRVFHHLKLFQLLPSSTKLF